MGMGCVCVNSPALFLAALWDTVGSAYLRKPQGNGYRCWHGSHALGTATECEGTGSEHLSHGAQDCSGGLSLLTFLEESFLLTLAYK